MKTSIFFLSILFIFCGYLSPQQQETPVSDVRLVALGDGLYLDTMTLPPGFDDATLARLFAFLKEHVIPDCRTTFGDPPGACPVIVRYVPREESGRFPDGTEGFAGLCDRVAVVCEGSLEGHCTLLAVEPSPGQTVALLALIAIPDPDDADYAAALWGFTAHELAHVLGAVDGPRCPFYDDDHRLEPVQEVSDTYFWFGIAGVFEAGFRGVVWDAWQNTCVHPLCEALRHEVFGFA